MDDPVQPYDAFSALARRVRACRICQDRPDKTPLPHAPRPILQGTSHARLAICSQAPGTRAHASGKPFKDPSGVRLRHWLGLDEMQFYNPDLIAIVPMGFCFPGQDAKGGDLPPRRECKATWHDSIFPHLPNLEVLLMIGQYALAYHLGTQGRKTLTQTVSDWRSYWYDVPDKTDGVHSGGYWANKPHAPRLLPLPHPSWRNNAWLNNNPWFEQEVLPVLRQEVTRLTQ